MKLFTLSLMLFSFNLFASDCKEFISKSKVKKVVKGKVSRSELTEWINCIKHKNFVVLSSKDELTKATRSYSFAMKQSLKAESKYQKTLDKIVKLDDAGKFESAFNKAEDLLTKSDNLSLVAVGLAMTMMNKVGGILRESEKKSTINTKCKKYYNKMKKSYDNADSEAMGLSELKNEIMIQHTQRGAAIDSLLAKSNKDKKNFIFDTTKKKKIIATINVIRKKKKYNSKLKKIFRKIKKFIKRSNKLDAKCS
jgi:hypothetical protein